VIQPDIPENEALRLDSLKEYSILDTLPEKEYDEITLLASMICGTPISLISLIDQNRQWFKSHHGTHTTQTSRDVAFCAHAINEPNKILVVEDSALISMLMELYLRDAGYQPLIAGDAKQAQEILAQETPVLMLMDIYLPEMNGYMLVKMLRERGYQQPIIALSASNLDQDREYALANGFDAYLLKPVEMETLLDAIETHLSCNV